MSLMFANRTLLPFLSCHSHRRCNAQLESSTFCWWSLYTISSHGHSLSFLISFANLSFNCFRTSALNDFTFSATVVAVAISLNPFNFMTNIMTLLLAHTYRGILSYATSSAFNSSCVLFDSITNDEVF